MPKIATWNVNSLRVRLAHVLEWLENTHPDILAIQETKLVDQNFPIEEINDAGYQAVYSGQKTYNGVAILSKTPATDVITDIPGLDDTQRRLLAATFGDIRIVNVYVPNGQSVGSEKYQYKLDWLSKLTAYISDQLKHYPQLVLLGDFNIAPDDRDVHDPEQWEGQILCSKAERAAFQEIRNAGLVDTYRLFEREEKEYSWWDYRMAGFRRNLGLRIDLILASEKLRESCLSCNIDKEPRKWERPSDHAPVIAHFN